MCDVLVALDGDGAPSGETKGVDVRLGLLGVARAEAACVEDDSEARRPGLAQAGDPREVTSRPDGPTMATRKPPAAARA